MRKICVIVDYITKQVCIGTLLQGSVKLQYSEIEIWFAFEEITCTTITKIHSFFLENYLNKPLELNSINPINSVSAFHLRDRVKM